MKQRSFGRQDPRETDLALIARFKRGEARAFDLIVDKHWPGVTRLAARRLGPDSAAEAEDVASEVFSALHGELPRWRAEASLYTWLFKTTANRCASRAQSRSRRRRISERLATQSAPAVDEGRPDEPLRLQEESRRVQAALRKLSERRRAVTVMHYCHGAPPAEIASVLNVSVSTIRGTLQKSLKLLRGILGRGE